uniref:39S ribosomal protein L1, mitochondrial n=1 Tax=Steinernema glaseri TaxID=37863 RepID=A0A1I7YUV4_9BILA
MSNFLIHSRCFSMFSGVGEFLRPSTAVLQQNRGRKRALKATLTRAQKLERRMKREEKEAARKQYNFMERISIRRMKSLLSPSQQFPGRFDADAESDLPEKPTCNVYLKDMVKTQFYPISKALEIHRLMQQPSIYNNPNAPVRLRLELNMTTERQTKMIGNSDQIVPVPFPFKHNEKRTIMAFASSPQNQEIAIESGAEVALGPDMIKKIIKGQFRTDDYDFCVAHSEMSSHILPLRGILKSRFPTRINGGLGDDLPEIIEKFKNGIKLSVKGDPVYPVWGLCDAIVGRLSMNGEELEANIATVIETLCKQRNPALGPFINRALMMVIPGDAFIPIDVNKYAPVPTEEEIERVEKRKNKKKKKEATVESEVEQEVATA